MKRETAYSNLSLSNLIRQKYGPTNYITNDKPFWDVLALFSSHQTLKIKERSFTQEINLSATTYEFVDFTFSPHSSKSKSGNNTVSIRKSDLEAALQSPTKLPDGKWGVHISKRYLFNRSAEEGGLAMTINFFFGSGYGDQNISLIFNEDNTLDSINITESYKGNRTLFTAKGLQYEGDILAQRREKSRVKEQEQKSDAAENRFNF